LVACIKWIYVALWVIFNKVFATEPLILLILVLQISTNIILIYSSWSAILLCSVIHLQVLIWGSQRTFRSGSLRRIVSIKADLLLRFTLFFNLFWLIFKIGFFCFSILINWAFPFSTIGVLWECTFLFEIILFTWSLFARLIL